MDVNMKGYLTKVKEVKTGMKRLSVKYGTKKRWFELEGHELRYYESAENATERKHESLRGFIDIFDIQSVREIATPKPTFEIVTRRKGSLCLIAETEEVRNKWIDTLQLAMRLKRSTVSVSEILNTSTSEDISGNSDDEFWNKDSSTGQQHFYSTIGHTDDTCEDDVFDDVESKHRKLKTHIYEQCDFAVTENHNPNSPIIHVTADDESSLAYAVVNKRQPSSSVSNQNTFDAGVHRESGYETTEPGDASDNIYNYNEIGGIEVGDEYEEADGKLHDEVTDDGDKRAVDLLKDLLRKTVVSCDLEDTTLENDEDETIKEEEEISAMDKLRALLGNE